jgi:uncharacterized membrane protein
MLLPIHVAAGGLALVLGAVALLARKGGTIHRRSGVLFVYAMLVMGATASILGFLKRPTDGNVFAGLMTAYFVGTAWTTVRPETAWTRRMNVAALTVVLGLAVGDVIAGVEAFNNPGGLRNGVPYQMLFFIATIMIVAAIGDARVLRCGMPRGGPRLARHLWRMCFALFIAAGSFFSVRERVATILPAPFTTAPMRALPILLLCGAMFYWLWSVRRAAPSHRVRRPAARPASVVEEAPPAAGISPPSDALTELVTELPHDSAESIRQASCSATTRGVVYPRLTPTREDGHELREAFLQAGIRTSLLASTRDRVRDDDLRRDGHVGA